MARYSTRGSFRKSNSKGKSTSKKTGSSKFSEAERLAYNLGRVQKGLKNSNSKVSAAYKAGQNSVQFKQQKPLV